MFYLGRYSIWEELFPNEFNINKNFPEELLKYQTIIDELYISLKNSSGKVEDYIGIEKLIKYFKGAFVNISNNA